MDDAPIYEAADPLEAGIVVNLLAAQGIAARVIGQHAWGGRGELAVNAYPRIHLLEARDRPAALALIREYQVDDCGSDWECPRCHETSGSRFWQCWQCGGTRPE